MREPPTAHERWVLLHGGQGLISLEYQTYTSAHPFDTLVTGLNGCRVGGTPCYDGRYGAHRVGHLGGHLSGYLETVPDAL